MEEKPNNPTPPTPIVTAPPPPAATVPTPMTTSQPPETPVPAQPSVLNSPMDNSPKGNKTLLFVILGIVFVVVIGTIYVISMGQSSKTNTSAIPTQIVPSPTPTAIPTPSPSAEEINNLDTGDPTQDVNTLNQDVNQL